MMVYVVVDTNVLVSALLSKHSDSSTAIIRKYLFDGIITPLYNNEIYKEYVDVLHRPKFHLPTEQVEAILEAIAERGLILGRTESNEVFLDPKDVVVTGNTKHFPKTPIVVTPAELLEIIENK